MPARTAVITLPITQVALLERFEAIEHLSELFVIHVDVVSREPDVDFLPQLGKGAVITVSDEDQHRQFSGLIYEAEFTDETEAGYRYRLTLRPWLYALTRNLEFKIFQNLSTTDIIQKVFDSRGCSDFRLNLHGTYSPREYCVQYRESDFDFVSRLMEEDGIYYFFEHSGGKHTMVLCDDPASHSKGQYDFLPYLPHAQSALLDKVWRWTEHVSTGVEGKATYRSFDFTRPAMQLEGVTTALPLSGASGGGGGGDDDGRLVADEGDTDTSKPAALADVYDFPQAFLDSSRGEALGKITIDASEVQRRTYYGEGDALWLACGAKVSVERHPLDRLNQEYVILSLVYRLESQNFVSGGGGGGGGPPATITVGAFPATQRFKAQQRTPRPVPRGPETAFVIGPGGQTIYTDKYGRVKVHFHWDRVGSGQDQTCWIRVAWASADNGFGHFVIPRIGQEVLVDFVNGNPDEPIIVGSLYNGVKVNSGYALPGDATRSVWRSHTINGGADDYNEISMEDKTGAEIFNVQAQKDRTTLVKNDDTLTVRDGNLTTTVKKGDETREVSKGKRTTTIMMNEALTIQSGDMSTEVQSGKKSTKVKGDYDNKVTDGDYTLKVDSGQITVEAAKMITLTCGQSKITMDPTSIKIESLTINVLANAELNTNGKATANHTSDGMLAVSAPMVTINS